MAQVTLVCDIWHIHPMGPTHTSVHTPDGPEIHHIQYIHPIYATYSTREIDTTGRYLEDRKYTRTKLLCPHRRDTEHTRHAASKAHT